MTVSLTVTGQNDVPTLGGGTLAADEDGTAVSLDLSGLGDDADAEDDGDSLTYTILSQPGEGSASITGSTVTFDPGSDFQDLAAGETREVEIALQATDAQNATSEAATITVTVTGVDDAPIIGGLTAATVDENTLAVGTVSATDVDAAGPVTFGIAGGADQALFQINANTGALRFVTAPNFEAPGDVGGDNVYEVEVAAFGGPSSVSTQAISVTVADIDEGGPTLNEVIGTNGIDRLRGTTEADRIDLLAGRLDIATGLGGADVFDFTSSVNNGARERKVITDFDAAEGDLLDLGGANVLNVTVRGGSSFVTLDGDNDQLVLIGVSNFETDFIA